MKHRTALGTLAITVVAASSWTIAPCPAAQPASNADGVLPIRLPEQNDPEIRKVQDSIYQSTQVQARYVLALVHPWSEDPELKLMTDSKSLEHWIRPNTMALQGLAFLYRFGPYDEQRVGISRPDLLAKIICPMMRYLTTTHVTGTRPTSDGKKWGDHWQSAYWAQMLGRAAWWVWDDLPPDIRAGVRSLVAHEADRFVGEEPPHQLKNDTKAEENAWNSKIFDMAVVLMPSDPRRPAWEKAFQRWALSAFLRPADEHSSVIIDGRPLSEQFLGANIYDDFTLENHRRVHPDYMGTFIMTLGCALDHEMTGRQPPEALLHNARGIYENLKWFFLPDGGCVYPNGEDWELFNNISKWIDTHTQMMVYAGDPDAWSLMRPCLATVEKMHARDPDGPLFAREEWFYSGAQQAALERGSRDWLILQTAKAVVDRPRPLLGVKRLDAGKIIIHRTPKAIHSVSWGAVIMAQCVPWRLDRVVSPDQRNGIGHVRLKGEKDILPVQLDSAKVTDSPDGFVAELVINHGQAVQASLEFRSNADGTFRLRETLTALRDMTTTQIATGLIGVLNNPKWVYETHRRRISLGDQTEDIPSLSGKTAERRSVREINIDGALRIQAAAPLSACYLGTKEIERGRATDKLYLNYLDGERNWTKGQVISTYEATVTPLVEPAAP